jgi:ABC-type transporter Mla maintaining outer membrane lipid asymmetry ATPase subunit MlaF
VVAGKTPPAKIIFLLIIRDLKITIGARTLFENVSFQVNYGERVALVGPIRRAASYMC